MSESATIVHFFIHLWLLLSKENSFLWHNQLPRFHPFFFSSVVYIIDFTIQDCKEKSRTRTSFSCLDISLEIPGDYSNLVTDRTLIVVLPEMAQQDVKCASGVIEPLDAVVLLVCASPVRLCAFCNWVIVVVTTILSALFRLLSFCDTTGIY